MSLTDLLPQTTRLGRYEVVGHLADGGMAEIVLGRIVGPSGFQRPVVIKRILPHLSRQQDFVQMFLDEARIVAGIRHPNVVQVHELGNDDGNLFLVMEYLEGESLAGLMRRLRAQGETLDHSLSAFIIAEACAGLHAAHDLVDPSGNKQNVVHRDVSPQNVFITYDGQVKVLDFGIAVAADRVTRTEAGTFKGKFEYASPEQCRGKPLDRTSDIWALGVVLYEVSTGTRLFKRSGQLDTLRAICDEAVVPPAEDVPGYPEAMSNVVMRALARSREARYPTAFHMRKDLLAALKTISDVDTDTAKENLGALMQRLFADRVEDKAELLRRVQSGSAVTHIPAVDTDVTVEIPVKLSGFPSAMPEGSASAVVLPRMPSAPLGFDAPNGAPAKRPPLALIVAVAALLGFAAISALVFLLRTPEKPEVQTAAPAPVVSTAPVASALPAEILVHVESDPPGAHVLIGVEDHGTAPLDLKLPRSSTPLVLAIKRDGYRAVEERVVPEMDQRLHVTLVAEHHVSKAPAVHPHAPGPAATPTSSAKGSKYGRFE